MRVHGTVAVAFFALALHASCAPLSATPLPGPSDAGPGDGGMSGNDGGSSSGSSGGSDSGACAPGDVATYQPVYHPADAAGMCNQLQITGFYEACLGTHKSSTACHDFQSLGENAACVGCIVTPDTAPLYGPIIDHGSFVTANVAGCIELLVDSAGGQATCADAGASELACAKAVQALDGCEVAACEANCDVHDTASLAAYQSCAGASDSGGCATYAQAASCAAVDAGACSAPSACLTPLFDKFYADVVPLFCLPRAPIDAGGPPVDSGVADSGLFDSAAGD